MRPHHRRRILALFVFFLVLTCKTSAQNVEAWIEYIDDRVIHVGCWNPDDPSRLPKFFVKIEGNEYPVAYVSPGQHREEAGPRTHIKMAFAYHIALRLLYGSNYMRRNYDLAFIVADPETGTKMEFHRSQFYPSPYTDLTPGEAKVVNCSYRPDPATPGLDVYLAAPSRPGRAFYRLLYPSTAGPLPAIARNLAHGVFYAFLPGFPEGADPNTIRVESSAP